MDQIPSPITGAFNTKNMQKPKCAVKTKKHVKLCT